MAWLKLEDTFNDHPKFDDLADELDCHPIMARGHIASLWSWTIRHAPDGDLSGFRPRAIAKAAGWEGEPETFVDALLTCRLLDEDKAVHNWMDRAGSYKESQRKADERAKKKKSKPAIAGVQDCPGHVPDMSKTVLPRGEEKRREDREERTGHVRSAPVPDARCWVPGDPISSTGDFERALSHWRIKAGNLSGSARKLCHDLTATEPIQPHEYAYALEQSEGKRVKSAASYILAVIKSQRTEAAQENSGSGLRASKSKDSFSAIVDGGRAFLDEMDDGGGGFKAMPAGVLQ